MAQPVFRNPDKYQVLPIREYIRKNLPSGDQGLVVEDLDLVPLMFSKLVGRAYNADGKFMLVEVKEPGHTVDYSQRRLFEMMDRLLRIADPDGEYYIGFYLLRWNNIRNLPVDINGKACTEQEFKDWMTGKITIEPVKFNHKRK